MSTPAPKSLYESIQQDAEARSEKTTPEQATASALVVAKASIKNELGMVPAVSLSEAGEFATHATDLAASPAFLLEASKAIGMPREGETKVQFVERAKNVLRDLLRRLLRAASS